MSTRFKFRTQYEGDEAAGKAAGFDCLDKDGLPQESLTQQSFAEQADINWIVQRCGVKDHELPVAPPIDPKYYGDCTALPDLRQCLDVARDAQEKFMALPAALRARFHNRAELLWEFVSKEENWEKAVELGILRKEPAAQRRSGDEPPRRREADRVEDELARREYRERRKAAAPGGPAATASGSER